MMTKMTTPLTARLLAPADAGGGPAPKLTSTDRAISSLVKAVGKDVKSEERAEAARRKAVGETFAAWIEGEDEEIVRRVFTGLEVAATRANRKRIASHALQPDGVEALVEKRLAEIARARAEAEAAADRDAADPSRQDQEASASA